MIWQAALSATTVATFVLLGACGQRSDNFLEELVVENVRQIAGLGRTREPPPPLPTRAQLEQLPGPLLAIGFVTVSGTGFVSAVNATPDGYVTYQDRTRRSVTLRGGLVTGLQGFRFDLSAVKTQRDDPIVHQTPVAIWPASYYRSYQFSLKSAPNYQISVECRITPVAQEQIIVFEQAYEVRRIEEECANDRRRFTNTYWADPRSGFIWKSVQWVGPRLQPMAVEIVRPHPASRVAY